MSDNIEDLPGSATKPDEDTLHLIISELESKGLKVFILKTGDTRPPAQTDEFGFTYPRLLLHEGRSIESIAKLVDKAEVDTHVYEQKRIKHFEIVNNHRESQEKTQNLIRKLKNDKMINISQ